MDPRKAQYKAVFEALTAILNAADLVGLIRLGAPKDEYSADAERLTALIIRQEPVTAELIANMFGEPYGFSERTEQYLKACKGLAKELAKVDPFTMPGGYVLLTSGTSTKERVSQLTAGVLLVAVIFVACGLIADVIASIRRFHTGPVWILFGVLIVFELGVIGLAWTATKRGRLGGLAIAGVAVQLPDLVFDQRQFTYLAVSVIVVSAVVVLLLVLLQFSTKWRALTWAQRRIRVGVPAFVALAALQAAFLIGTWPVPIVLSRPLFGIPVAAALWLAWSGSSQGPRFTWLAQVSWLRFPALALGIAMPIAFAIWFMLSPTEVSSTIQRDDLSGSVWPAGAPIPSGCSHFAATKQVEGDQALQLNADICWDNKKAWADWGLDDCFQLEANATCKTTTDSSGTLHVKYTVDVGSWFMPFWTRPLEINLIVQPDGKVARFP